MHPVATKLLEEHIEFELDALTGKDLQPALRAEVGRGFELAEQLTLNDLATQRRCVAAFKRLLVKAEIPQSAGELVVSLVLRFARHVEDAGLDVQAAIRRDRFLELVELAATLHEPRRRLFAELFNHPLYGDLISSLIYKALVNYLVEDNLISQKVPGVGSMLKLGRKAATRAVPGLDATLERQLNSYIKRYLPSLIKSSEQYVERIVTDPELTDRLSEAWPDIASREFAGMAEGVDPKDVERFADWGQGYWDELRRSDHFSEMGETLIAHMYELYGNEPVSVLLDDLGITRSMVSKELLAFAPPLLKRLRASGYLSELLRRRLAPFYESEAVTKTLGASLER